MKHTYPIKIDYIIIFITFYNTNDKNIFKMLNTLSTFNKEKLNANEDKIC